MQILKILSQAAVGIAVIAVAVAAFKFIGVFAATPVPALLVDRLGEWVSYTGHCTAIILLAAVGTVYLANKK